MSKNMKRWLLSLINCPNCGDDEFAIEQYKSNVDEIIDGRLICKSCNIWYRIEHGILDLLPLSLRRRDKHENFAKKYGLIFESIAEREDGQKEHQMRFFARFSKTYDKEVAYNPYYSTFDRVVFGDWIKRNLQSGQTILDLGCGSGVQSTVLAKRKIYTVGVDISEEMLLLAKRKAEDLGVSGYLALIIGDAEKSPVKDGSFDAGYMVGTLHHVQNPEMVVRDVSNKLRKGGVIFTSDNHKSPVRFLFDFLMKIWELYQEEARDEPLFVEKQLNTWYQSAGIKSEIKLSTYLPPHIFLFFSKGLCDVVLKISNAIFGTIPYIRGFAGIIVVEGEKI